jgi:hypothetical protein
LTLGIFAEISPGFRAGGHLATSIAKQFIVFVLHDPVAFAGCRFEFFSVGDFAPVHLYGDELSSRNRELFNSGAENQLLSGCAGRARATHS